MQETPQHPYSARQREEAEHHASYEWPRATWQLEESALPQKYKEFLRVLDAEFPGEQPLAGKRVLDCGCGFGVLSLMLARRGAKVEAFDISPNMVAITRRLAAENGVGDSVKAEQSAIEDLRFAPGFDLIVGTNVLHHVEVEVAAQRLAQLIAPSGRILFWEPIVTHPVREAVRKAYRRSLSWAHRGTSGEHPLTPDEISVLERHLGHVEIQPLSFAPFTLLLSKLLPIPLPRVRRIVGRIDLLIDRMLPVLRRAESNQVLFFRDPATPGIPSRGPRVIAPH